MHKLALLATMGALGVGTAVVVAVPASGYGGRHHPGHHSAQTTTTTGTYTTSGWPRTTTTTTGTSTTRTWQHPTTSTTGTRTWTTTTGTATTTSGRLCRARHRGYSARGTLVSWSLTRNVGGRYSGSLTVDVLKGNRHAQGATGTDVTYTVSDARVWIGPKAQPPAAGDRVALSGTITVLPKRCSTSGFTPTTTIRRIVVAAPRSTTTTTTSTTTTSSAS